jgi:hypothetical protein
VGIPLKWVLLVRAIADLSPQSRRWPQATWGRKGEFAGDIHSCDGRRPKADGRATLSQVAKPRSPDAES